MKVLTAGIITKFSGSALATSLSNKLYNTVAPQDVSMPYGTFSVINNMYNWMFALEGEFEDLIVQFSLFFDDQSPVNIEDTYNNLIALYDWCTLSVTGYTHLYMRREGSRLFRYEEGNQRFWHKSIDYRILLEKD